MWKKIALPIVIGAVVLLAIGCSAGATPAPAATATPAPAATATPAGVRTVDLEIAADKITPASVEVKKGETVTFNAKNVSDTEVELIVGTQADVDADSGDSLKEAEEIAPGTTKSVTYTFDGDGPYAYGDQIGSHYANGAKGVIVLMP